MSISSTVPPFSPSAAVPTTHSTADMLGQLSIALQVGVKAPGSEKIITRLLSKSSEVVRVTNSPDSRKVN